MHPFSFRIYEAPTPSLSDATNLARAPELDEVSRLYQELDNQESELKRLRQAVLHDPITRGANVRSLHLVWESLEVEDPCSVLVVDIDGFKRVNDSLGRPAGNAVLQAVATAMERSVRWDDVVAREGADRFIVLLPLAIEEDAHAVGERIRASVAKMCFQTDLGRFRVTVRVGCSSRGQDDEFEEIVARADQACREAKQHGGDVVFFE